MAGDVAAPSDGDTQGGEVTPTPAEPRPRPRGLPRGDVPSPTRRPCGDERDAPQARQRRRIEIVSSGIDDALQGRGGNPYGGLSWAGLRVPAFVNAPASRYLFQLARFSIPEGQRARVVGMRHGWTLGVRQAPPRVIEQWIQDPFFKLPDGNVSWHLRKMPQNFPFVPRPGPIFPPMQNFAFETTDTPALLYQAAAGFAGGFYVTLGAYTPPNRGMPWGEPLTGDLGTFNDLKTNWRDGSDWMSLDIPIEAGVNGTSVAFFASVLQTNPVTRPVYVPPPAALSPPQLNFPLGTPSDEQFLLTNPTANIWRVAGALIVELEDDKP